MTNVLYSLSYKIVPMRLLKTVFEYSRSHAISASLLTRHSVIIIALTLIFIS